MLRGEKISIAVRGERKRFPLLETTHSCTLSRANLIPVSINPVSSQVSSLNLAVLHIRSLAGKSLIINDFIINHSLNFMFLTETWLDDNNSGAVLIETAPPNFSFIGENRAHRKAGGVATLFNNSFLCKNISMQSFPSFE